MKEIIEHVLNYFNNNCKPVKKLTEAQKFLRDNGAYIPVFSEVLKKKTPKYISEKNQNLINSYYSSNYTSYKANIKETRANFKKREDYWKSIDPVYKTVSFCTNFGTDNLFKIFTQLKSYDAYGSGLYQHGKHNFHILNDYGDSDLERNPLRIQTLALIDSKKVIHCIDIVYDLEKKCYVAENYQSSKLPSYITQFPIKNFIGKRAFYYRPKNKTINVRCDEKKICKIDPKYHIGNKNDLSGIRININLEKSKL